MASGAVLEDDTLFSRLDRRLFWLETQMAVICGLAVFSLMLMAVYSVGGRNLFNSPMPGYVDWIEQVMPLIAFMALSYTQRLGGHIRMDIVVGRLKGRILWAAEWFTTLVVLILILFLIWGSFSHFLRSFDMSVPLWSRDSSIDISLPIWPAKLVVPVAFSLGKRMPAMVLSGKLASPKMVFILMLSSSTKPNSLRSSVTYAKPLLIALGTLDTSTGTPRILISPWMFFP